MKKIKILLLIGGGGVEHEVSLASGKEVLKHFNLDKYEVVKFVLESERVDIKKIKEIKADIVFIVMHGGIGEDGRLQKILEEANIKFIGCDSKSSAIGMDKVAFKKIMKEANLPIPEGIEVKKNEKIDLEKVKKLGNKLIVKPVSQGSSVGVSLVNKLEDLNKAVALAFKYDDRILIERMIEGVEVSCGLLGNTNPIALPVIEICPKNDFFDYEAKYIDNKCDEIVPARLDSEVSQKIQEYSLKVFSLIGGRGFSRVDLIVEKNKPIILEINTIPGLTPNSLLPKEAMAGGMSYGQLLDKMVELGLED